MLNKVIPFKFCSIYRCLWDLGTNFLFKISQSMYHIEAYNETFQALFYIFQKYINTSDMCFYMRHEDCLTHPKKMFLSKLSRKCFSDLGQAIPFIDLPKKTVSIIATKKYFQFLEYSFHLFILNEISFWILTKNKSYLY